MHITLKLATTLDGRIATRTGDSQWITSPEARAVVHELRARHDGVLAGIGTVLADNPMLTVRANDVEAEHQPHRIVLDTHLRTPPDARIFSARHGRVFIVCGRDADETSVNALGAAGGDVLRVETDAGGHIDINSAVTALSKQGLSSLFIEGGGQVAAAFLKAGLVDELHWFRAPKIIGGDGIPALGGWGISDLADVITFRRKAVRTVGPDVWEVYEKE